MPRSVTVRDGALQFDVGGEGNVVQEQPVGSGQA
jgi:hypothetical protein